jgi:hypothetical protein
MKIKAVLKANKKNYKNYFIQLDILKGEIKII